MTWKWIRKRDSELKVISRTRKWIECGFAKKIVNWKWIREKIVNWKWIREKIVNWKWIHEIEFMNQTFWIIFMTQFNIFFTKSLSIHYLFREFTFNSLSISRIHFQFTIFFAKSLSIHYLFRESKSNSLPLLRIYFQFTIYFANSLSIHYLFCEFTFKSLSFSRNHF